MAVFNAQAKVGKLQDWAVIRAKFRPAPTVTVPQDWRARKAERSAQMAQLKKHQAIRNKPVKGKHGR